MTLNDEEEIYAVLREAEAHYLAIPGLMEKVSESMRQPKAIQEEYNPTDFQDG